MQGASWKENNGNNFQTQKAMKLVLIHKLLYLKKGKHKTTSLYTSWQDIESEYLIFTTNMTRNI